MYQKKLNEILKDHEEWIETNGRMGKRADLHELDFSWADLHGLDLSWADLHGAYLCEADLRDTNFYNANLYGANIYRADIRGANFCGAYLRGAILPKGVYTAGGVGSQQRYTYYDAVNDHVICGCWDDDAGNHLDSFKKRIENIYGPDGKTSNPAHYKAYKAVISYFETCREAYNMGV